MFNFSVTLKRSEKRVNGHMPRAKKSQTGPKKKLLQDRR